MLACRERRAPEDIWPLGTSLTSRGPVGDDRSHRRAYAHFRAP
jgi:hypothetical protein